MRAPDDIIVSWARENGYIVFTHDLDFGVLLAWTRAESPSVIQVRTQDVFPGVLGDRRVKGFLSIHSHGCAQGGHPDRDISKFRQSGMFEGRN
jgi:predicted nuclease of predicted toxin-antitoxin system